MKRHAATAAPAAQASALVAHRLSHQLATFLAPILRTLDRRLDRRLVGTFLATLIAIVQWRNRPHGLLLSELGGYLLTPQHAPAGTKRLSNLLRSPYWSASLIADWLWQQADARLQALCAAGEQPLLVWDGSVLEKPETIKNSDLCAVRSSKARRLKRIRPGFFNPPGGRPICVPGLHWLGLLVLGRTGAPSVAAMQWWTSRGQRASDQRTQVRSLLTRSVAAWGRHVWHIWDREFASAPWLCLMLEANIRFVLRWKKRQKLLDGWGEARKAWEITRGKRSWEYRHLRDTHTGERHKVGVVAVCVTHPQHPQPLWLVVARPGRHYEPWYLLTSQPIRTADDAWRVVLAYGRRWQIEIHHSHCPYTCVGRHLAALLVLLPDYYTPSPDAFLPPLHASTSIILGRAVHIAKPQAA
jgi:Transposase DDE domain